MASHCLNTSHLARDDQQENESIEHDLDIKRPVNAIDVRCARHLSFAATIVRFATTVIGENEPHTHKRW